MRENGIRIRIRRLTDTSPNDRLAADRRQSWVYTHGSLSEQMQIIEGHVEYQVDSAQRVLAHAVEHGRVRAGSPEAEWTVAKAVAAYEPLIMHVCHTSSEHCHAMRADKAGASIGRGTAGAECLYIDLVPADQESDQAEIDLKAAKSYT